MKKSIKVIILGVACVVFVVFYINFDSKGYNYGYDCMFCSKELPYNLQPQINRYYYVDLIDEEGFELVGAGFKYRRSSFKIKDFLAYGYNDTSIVIKCTDSLNNVKYLSSYETKNRSSKGNPEISFKDIASTDFEQVQENYKWIDVNKKKAEEIERYKTYLFIGMLLFFTLFIWQLIKKIKATPAKRSL